jgi:hypothetical protein
LCPERNNDVQVMNLLNSKKEYNFPKSARTGQSIHGQAAKAATQEPGAEETQGF